jgi:DmsE family decaheme c-type cytochrome
MRSTKLAGFVVLVAGLALGQAEKPQAAQPQAEKPGFAGTDTCQICHEDTVKGFEKNPHHALETDAHKGFAGHACESCHGPGDKHAESADASLIRNPGKQTAAAADRVCMDCHLNQPTHVGRLESSHARGQVACTSCHKVHSDEMVARTAAKINTQCASCHTSEWAQFQRPDHHKLPEGAMSCVDCHNPHGSIRPTMQQSFGANEPGCLTCHGDKRGPFTFEHAPMRLDGCTACHEPHGSANPRMLKRQEVRLVCLECHASLPTARTNTSPPNRTIGVVPPSFHDLRSPQYQNCTICHQKVHGSYVDRDLLK